jgi:hypothetical protein
MKVDFGDTRATIHTGNWEEPSIKNHAASLLLLATVTSVIKNLSPGPRVRRVVSVPQSASLTVLLCRVPLSAAIVLDDTSVRTNAMVFSDIMSVFTSLLLSYEDDPKSLGRTS